MLHRDGHLAVVHARERRREGQDGGRELDVQKTAGAQEDRQRQPKMEASDAGTSYLELDKDDEVVEVEAHPSGDSAHVSISCSACSSC